MVVTCTQTAVTDGLARSLHGALVDVLGQPRTEHRVCSPQSAPHYPERATDAQEAAAKHAHKRCLPPVRRETSYYHLLTVRSQTVVHAVTSAL